jgi:hypothetical protein
MEADCWAEKTRVQGALFRIFAFLYTGKVEASFE